MRASAPGTPPPRANARFAGERFDCSSNARAAGPRWLDPPAVAATYRTSADLPESPAADFVLARSTKESERVPAQRFWASLDPIALTAEMCRWTRNPWQT
jgi:hypothetical protein